MLNTRQKLIESGAIKATSSPVTFRKERGQVVASKLNAILARRKATHTQSK